MNRYLNIKECREILQKLIDDNFTIIRCQDWEQYKDRKDLKICILRHDLDMSIDWGLELGALEQEMGIHSTFFVLHTRPYYREPDFILKCKQLQDMGHEVGLHFDTLSECIQNPTMTHKMILDREIKYLRENGIQIHGLASHGGDYPPPKVVGYQIFKEFYLPNAPMKYHNIDLYTLNLADLGLYEAYWILRTAKFNYLSDCKGRALSSLIDQINNVTAKDGRIICQLLLHPCNHTCNFVPPKSKFESESKSKKSEGKQYPHP
jgi:hypothetical protein